MVERGVDSAIEFPRQVDVRELETRAARALPRRVASLNYSRHAERESIPRASCEGN